MQYAICLNHKCVVCLYLFSVVFGTGFIIIAKYSFFVLAHRNLQFGLNKKKPTNEASNICKSLDLSGTCIENQRKYQRANKK